jgi:hypothetical protein
LSPCNERTLKHVFRFMNGCSPAVSHPTEKRIHGSANKVPIGRRQARTAFRATASLLRPPAGHSGNYRNCSKICDPHGDGSSIGPRHNRTLTENGSRAQLIWSAVAAVARLIAASTYRGRTYHRPSVTLPALSLGHFFGTKMLRGNRFKASGSPAKC